MSDSLCGLHKAAALCDLAEAIWETRARVYRLPVPRWEAVSLEGRRAYLQIAQDVIGAVKPADQAEWPAALFEQVAAVARAEAARVLRFPREAD